MNYFKYFFFEKLKNAKSSATFNRVINKVVAQFKIDFDAKFFKNNFFIKVDNKLKKIFNKEIKITFCNRDIHFLFNAFLKI